MLRKKILFFLLLTSIFILSNGVSFSQTLLEDSQSPVLALFKEYNNPVATQNLNIHLLEYKRQIRSTVVVSPDLTKAAYTEVYFLPQSNQTTSKAFYFTFGESLAYENNHQKILDTLNPDNHKNQKTFMMDSGFNTINKEIFRTLTIVDWSADGNKLILKESVGENLRRFWATNLWIYNFAGQKAVRLDEIRKAVTYYWKKNYHLYLNDYRWDIIPLGWDASNNNRVIVNVYGYNYGSKHFLGCWSIDTNGKRSTLISLENEKYPVGKYGLILKTPK